MFAWDSAKLNPHETKGGYTMNNMIVTWNRNHHIPYEKKTCLQQIVCKSSDAQRTCRYFSNSFLKSNWDIFNTIVLSPSFLKMILRTWKDLRILFKRGLFLKMLLRSCKDFKNRMILNNLVGSQKAPFLDIRFF